MMELHLSSTFLLLILSISQFHYATPITLDDNGGYHLNVAIDPALNLADAGNSYINNIRSSIQLFSMKLWEATEGRFFINSTELLVPSHWEVNPQPQISISQSFESSDIKLSLQSKVPLVQNPNPCGRPGEFIQLPATFFDSPNNGDFGISWKVLLNQWARYRWGVWEEHGYPTYGTTDANKFPYFYQITGANDALEWTTNSCSNEELHGKYENINGDTCSLETEESPDSTCRFIPHASSKASTSLMSFHWLNSVTKFCNSENHNKLAPNAQNWFCNYKSIVEVMEETPDYAIVTNPLGDELPIPTFNTKKANNVLPFYLLVDRGFADSGATTIVTEVVRSLVPLYETILPKNTLTAFGTFPGETSELVEQVSWRFLENNEDVFLSAIGDVKLNGPTTRNFATALEHLSESIDKLNSPNGAVILLVKTEATPETFENITYEDQLFANLIQKKIKLFTIEIPNGGASPQFALESFTTRVGGMYVGLESSRNVSNEVTPILDQIKVELTNPVPTTPQVLISYSNTVNISSAEVSINIGTRKSKVHFALTLRNDVTINAQISLDGSSDYGIQTKDEWNVGKRYTKIVTHNYNERDNGHLTMRLSCTSGCSSGEVGHLVISEDLVEPLQNEVQITVFTSADSNNNNVDFELPLPELSPFSIYAKVEADGNKAVTNATVIATLTSRITNAKSIVELYDDGLGVPDVSKNDGIYSAVFIPPTDGNYDIVVKVEATGDASVVNRRNSRLLPVDQVEIGCGENGSGCEGVGLKDPISLVRSLSSPISFTNVDKYPNTGKPTKILNLKVINDIETQMVHFEFTSPKVLGDSLGKATKYVIKGATTQDAFFADDPSELVDVLTHEGFVNFPGWTESFSTHLYDEVYYFSIVSYNGDKESSMSPVVRIVGKPIVSVASPTTPSFESEGTSPGVTGSGNPDPDPTGTAPTSATDQPPTEDEKKPFFKTAGGIVLIVFIVLGVIAAAGGGFWYYKKKQSSRTTDYA